MADDDFDLHSEADKEKLRQKARLVDLIDYLREDGQRPFAEIDALFGRSNTQMWFRKSSKTIPNMESLERIAKVAGAHHTGQPWTLPQLLRYLKTGEFPEPEPEQASGVDAIAQQVEELGGDDSLRVIEIASHNLETPEQISKAINFCSFALARISRNP